MGLRKDGGADSDPYGSSTMYAARAPIHPADKKPFRNEPKPVFGMYIYNVYKMCIY
jgi:hypothetical protein